MTDCVLFCLFFLRVQFLSTCYFDTRQAYMLFFVQNRHLKKWGWQPPQILYIYILLYKEIIKKMVATSSLRCATGTGVGHVCQHQPVR
jgi:hypothetical protein